jgi:hypothetical protein
MSSHADDPLSLELLHLCRTITDDGDLTDKELYSLAEWLNEHPDACHSWPGNVLVDPLQRVWADGKINCTELKEMAIVLWRIESEYSRAYSSAKVQEALDSFTVSEARLPVVSLQAKVPSSTGDEPYDIDLAAHTCTCGDWVYKRREIGAGEIGRACKHIMKALRDVAPQGGWPAWFAGLIEDCCLRDRGPHSADLWYVVNVADHPVLFGTGASDWANVFEMKDGQYTRFGYNVIEDRWAYGERPYRSGTIVKAIREFVGDNRSRPF